MYDTFNSGGKKREEATDVTLLHSLEALISRHTLVLRTKPVNTFEHNMWVNDKRKGTRIGRLSLFSRYEWRWWSCVTPSFTIHSLSPDFLSWLLMVMTTIPYIPFFPCFYYCKPKQTFNKEIYPLSHEKKEEGHFSNVSHDKRTRQIRTKFSGSFSSLKE